MDGKNVAVLGDKEGGRAHQEQDVGGELVVDVAAVWRAPSEGLVQSMAEIMPRPTCGIPASDALATKTLHGGGRGRAAGQQEENGPDDRQEEVEAENDGGDEEEELENAHILDEVEEMERTVFG